MFKGFAGEILNRHKTALSEHTVTQRDDLLTAILSDVNQNPFRGEKNMACRVSFRAVNINVAQQNGGLLAGTVNITGLDASQKINVAEGTVFGSLNLEVRTLNINFDHGEYADAVINDQDVKSTWGFNA